MLKETLHEQVEAYDLVNEVKFLGVRSDINELLQAMDIFVFLSFEGLPVTLIEAQAAGSPILASDRITREAQITDLINFKSVDSDPYQWAKMIDDQYLLFRHDMSEKVVEAGYDVRDTAKELEEYYSLILEDGG